VAAGLGGGWCVSMEGEKLEVEDEGEPLDFNPVVQKIECEEVIFHSSEG